MEDYDSTADTLAHIREVNTRLIGVAKNILNRAEAHDFTKLIPPEKPLFDRMTPKLKGLEYGSEEYKESLRELQVALNHRYSTFDHHPEHYKDSAYPFNGVGGMSLMALIEMLVDWKAASLRTADGSMFKSFKISIPRFQIKMPLAIALYNTALELELFDSLDEAEHCESWLNDHFEGENGAAQKA